MRRRIQPPYFPDHAGEQYKVARGIIPDNEYFCFLALRARLAEPGLGKGWFHKVHKLMGHEFLFLIHLAPKLIEPFQQCFHLFRLLWCMPDPGIL